MDLVDCGRRKLRLTEKACADFWRQSNPTAPPAWEGRHACHQCPFGAARCGEKVDPHAAEKSRLALICPRCCNKTDRMVNGERCVSCYNRAEEVKRGKDRKGSVPGLARRLGSVTAVVLKAGRAELVTWENVTGFIEAAMMSARASSVPLAFGRCPPALHAGMHALICGDSVALGAA